MLAGQKKNLIAVAKNWYHQFSIHTLSLIQGNKSVCGFHLGYLENETELITAAMNTILDLYKEGKIKPRIDSTWHMEQVGNHSGTHTHTLIAHTHRTPAVDIRLRSGKTDVFVS